MSVSRTVKLEMGKEKEQVLMKKLFDHLCDKKYLIVIDDIWTKGAWEELEPAFPSRSKENLQSRVILTTRIRDVALHSHPVDHLHEIRLLGDGESWELFLKEVFRRGSAYPRQLDAELEDIGKKLLAKCGNLPLAIVVLGGLLSRKEETSHAWSKVLDSVSFYLADNPVSCKDILGLSYYDLPYHLKPCFLYLGLFPEDFEIRSKKLIRLWVAEGFIQQIRGDKILEDVADDYLEELIGRNMVQIASKSCNGTVRSCRMHDLFRDLAISVAKANNFFEIVHGEVDLVSFFNRKCRRLALYRGIETSIETLYHSSNTIRSELCFNDCDRQLLKLFSKSGKLLRVFCRWNGWSGDKTFLHDSEKLPNYVLMGNFFLLRYICFGWKILNIEIRPSCMADLCNLQTLEIDIDNKVVIPNAIYDLVLLRHLLAYGCEIEGQPRLKKLRNLLSLCLTAGSWIENGLDKLTMLRKLGIFRKGAGLATDLYVNSLPHSIEKLFNLRSLKIDYYEVDGDEAVVPFISFSHRHSYLYKMYLSGKPIDTLPDMPPNLLKLTLYGSKLKKDDIIKLEKLPKLVFLGLLDDWTCLRKWRCSSLAYPKLETLEVDCWLLEEFIIGGGAMPCLKSIQVYGPERLRIDHLAAKNYSGIGDYAICSVAPTVFGEDNASQIYEDDVGAPHATSSMVA